MPDSLPPAPELLVGEKVAFTGTLASMTHKEAAELVEQHGGNPVHHVSQVTTLLVVGEEGWPLEQDGHPSVKLLQAQQLQERGSPLRILSESEWLSALGLESQTRSQQWYTPAILSQMLGVSVHEIRRWERWKLIHPVKRVMRLPYFDLAEVEAARRLAGLVASGVPLQQVAESFEKLQQLMPDLKQPLAQLQILAGGREILYRDETGWLESTTGQRRLPFVDSEVEEHSDPQENPTAEDEGPHTLPWRPLERTPAPDWKAHDWFQHGCRLAEEGALAEAETAYRSALVEQPNSADYHFHLADVLYRLNRPQAAIERYYAAVEHDHDFIEAWTQLGCVLSEQQQIPAAREAFEIALDRHPEYPEAHFHLGQLLEQTGEHAAAIPHWQAYLQTASCGPWADVARQHLADSDKT